MKKTVTWILLALFGFPVLTWATLFALRSLDKSTLDDGSGYGTSPQLPQPEEGGPVPTLNPARAVGWPPETTPQAPDGFRVTRFAQDLDHPRWLYTLPNGDVLVAETNRASREITGITDWVAARMKAYAGAAVPSADRITLLRDADADGVPEVRSVFIEGLNSPSGMALVGSDFYVANTDALLRFPYKNGATEIHATGTRVASLPAAPPNNHWTRNLIVSRDGSLLYVAVGSNSNIGEGGLDNERNRACVLEISLDGSAQRVYASGLRNPNGLAWEPTTGVLWVTVNERDMLGHDLVPDYMTGLKPGGFYGWPYSYFGDHPDPRVPQDSAAVQSSIRPDFALGAHTASLGLLFYEADSMPERYHGGAFVAQHGSWNRNPRSGYKVIFVAFENGRPVGSAEDFVTGFLNAKGDARGRPVGLAVDRTGSLLVADDVGKTIWRVTAIP